MAREPVIRVVCDRTGEESFAPAGVTLENMNKGGPPKEPALKLRFCPVHGGEAMDVLFEDLSPRSEEQVKDLIDAIAASGFFVVSPFVADGEVISASANEPVTISPSLVRAPQSAPATVLPMSSTSRRRTYVEIESDGLNELVEAASAALGVLLESPDADDFAVADAREALIAALARREYFNGLDEKAQKKHTTDARAARKADQPVKYPALLPIPDDVLDSYGLLNDIDDQPTPTTATTPTTTTPTSPADDDDDIFAAPGDQGMDFL